MGVLSRPYRRGAALCRALAVASLCTLGLVLAAAPSPPAIAAAAASEYQLKAVFLFNFAQFVEWPPEAFETADVPIVIGVVGEDPFGPYLDDVVRGEQVKGRALLVKRFKRLEDVDDCHILFISSAEAARARGARGALAGRSILTVSDAGRTAPNATMIQFVDAQKRIRLRIDVETATAAGLTISSKLLRAAEIVPGGRG